MSETIAKMVEKGNAESIQRYVHNHLPADQQSLERIYNELLNYSAKPPKLEASSKKELKSSRSQSIKAIHNKPILLLSSGPVESYSKRTNEMIRKLKERGYKVVQNEEEKGLRVYETNKKKIVAPLITNAKLLQGGQAEIDRMIERFNANVDFYSNNIEDVEINLDNNIDREMREFMDRRLTVLEQLRTKQKKSLNNVGRYSGITSKLLGQEQRKTPPMTQRSRAFSHGQLNVWRTQQLMDTCQKELELRRYRQIDMKRNEFRSLENKVKEQIEEVDLGSIINLKKVKERMSKDQYNRYTHTYMKMMTNKMQEGSKCKLNGYAKELLQDQRKMRNIIDFSKK